MVPILWAWALLRLAMPAKAETPTNVILHKSVSPFAQLNYLAESQCRSSGVLKPGEMCLVLGCPGAGCTTFLKTIANHREGYANVTGDVLYAGIDATEMEKYYKGEVVYNQEGEKVLTFHALHTLMCGIPRRHPYRNAYCCSDSRIRPINVSVFE